MFPDMFCNVLKNFRKMAVNTAVSIPTDRNKVHRDVATLFAILRLG